MFPFWILLPSHTTNYLNITCSNSHTYKIKMIVLMYQMCSFWLRPILGWNSSPLNKLLLAKWTSHFTTCFFSLESLMLTGLFNVHLTSSRIIHMLTSKPVLTETGASYPPAQPGALWLCYLKRCCYSQPGCILHLNNFSSDHGFQALCKPLLFPCSGIALWGETSAGARHLHLKLLFL